jgi:hypothetical protein
MIKDALGGRDPNEGRARDIRGGMRRGGVEDAHRNTIGGGKGGESKKGMNKEPAGEGSRKQIMGRDTTTGRGRVGRDTYGGPSSRK